MSSISVLCLWQHVDEEELRPFLHHIPMKEGTAHLIVQDT